MNHGTRRREGYLEKGPAALTRAAHKKIGFWILGSERGVCACRARLHSTPPARHRRPGIVHGQCVDIIITDPCYQSSLFWDKHDEGVRPPGWVQLHPFESNVHSGMQFPVQSHGECECFTGADPPVKHLAHVHLAHVRVHFPCAPLNQAQAQPHSAWLSKAPCLSSSERPMCEMPHTPQVSSHGVADPV